MLVRCQVALCSPNPVCIEIFETDSFADLGQIRSWAHEHVCDFDPLAFNNKSNLSLRHRKRMFCSSASCGKKNPQCSSPNGHDDPQIYGHKIICPFCSCGHNWLSSCCVRLGPIAAPLIRRTEWRLISVWLSRFGAANNIEFARVCLWSGGWFIRRFPHVPNPMHKFWYNDSRD